MQPLRTVEPSRGSTAAEVLADDRRRTHDADRLDIKHMSDNEPSKHRSEADAELEREIREGRKFTLEEAIARMVGPGAMKGESPVTRMQQAEIEIGSWLRSHLTDSGGALEVVLHRRIKGSE